MASQRLHGKVAIVTGASSGLGRAIAFAYAREGALLVCADLREQPKPGEQTEDAEVNTHDLINRTGGKAVFVETDVTNSDQMRALVAQAVEAFGRLDIMVNNAGIGVPPRPMKFHEFDDEVWDRMMAVNTRSVFLGCKYAVAQMLRQSPHSSGHRGWVINTSSIAALIAIKSAPPSYSASKGAVSALTRQVAIDYAGDKIHCNAICPGFTRTAMMLDGTRNMDSSATEMINAMHPLGGVGEATSVAKAALVLASDDVDWITGVNLPVDGGYVAQ